MCLVFAPTVRQHRPEGPAPSSHCGDQWPHSEATQWQPVTLGSRGQKFKWVLLGWSQGVRMDQVPSEGFRENPFPGLVAWPLLFDQQNHPASPLPALPVLSLTFWPPSYKRTLVTPLSHLQNQAISFASWELMSALEDFPSSVTPWEGLFRAQLPPQIVLFAITLLALRAHTWFVSFTVWVLGLDIANTQTFVA